MPLIIKARKRNDPVLRSPKAKLNKAEQEIYDIYYKALSSMPKDLDNSSVLRTIRGAVEAGNPMDAAIAFQWRDFITSLDKTVPKLAQQVASSANISAKSLPKRIRIESSFTAQDPRAIAWAQKRAGARILGITKESQKAVAETIVRSLKTQLKREEVIDRITKVVGLDARQARALGNYYEKNLNSLLEEGYGYEEAVKVVTKLSKEYRERLLVQRATRIARTETVNAANAGRYLSWVEADAQGLLPTGSQKRWKTAQDERVCSICGPLHNVTIGWEESFSTGDVMPTNHPNCRCTAVIVPADPVFEKVVEKRYYRFADGEETWRNYDYRWRKIANEMKRRIGKCQRCGSKSDLTVDHKKRLKDGGAKYDRKNLRVLCRSCNGRASRLGTKLRKEVEPWWLTKHAPGKHNQQNHAGGRGSGGSSVPSRTFTAGQDDEIHAALKEDQGAYIDSLSEKQLKSVAGYQAEGTYDVVNGHLRGQSGPISAEDKELIQTFDGVIAGAGLQYNTTVYRGVSDTDGQFQELKVGDVILEKGYSSTSPNPAVAEGFANSSVIQGKPVVLEIDVPFGQSALASDVASSKLFGYDIIQDDPMMVEIAGFTRLNEVTLPRGLKMEVTNVVDKENARYVKVKINK